MYDLEPDNRGPYSLEELRKELQVGIDELDRGEGVSLDQLQIDLGLTLPPPSIGLAGGF